MGKRKAEEVVAEVEETADDSAALTKAEKKAKKAAKAAAAAAAAEVEAEETPKEKKKKNKAVVQEEAVAEQTVPAPEKKKKKKVAAVEEVAEVQAPAQEKKKKKKAVAEEEAAEEVAPPPEKKKKKKAAAVEEEAVEEAAATKKEKKNKKAAPDEEDVGAEEAPKPKQEKAEGSVQAGEELTVFVGGIPFSCTEDTLRKDFSECGEIEVMKVPLNEEGNPKGFAFITYKTKEGVEKACKFDGEAYGGRTLKVNVAGQKGKGGDKGKSKGDKGKGDKGKGGGKGNQELTVCVRGLPFATTEDALRKDFEDCGELERCKMLLNDEGTCKGIAFIEYKTKEGVEKACAFNETDYGGRTIYVSLAGEGGKGKDGKGKDGKGKDKGKDKGKGKGKKGKASSESFAKSTGAMVESTGEKKTFDDSDDE